MLELRLEGDTLSLHGNEYALAVPIAGPWRALLRVRGTPAAELFVPGCCDADGQRDAIARVGAPRWREGPEAIEIAIPAQSRLWGAVRYVFRGTASALEHFAQRRGARRPDNLHFFAGRRVSGGACLSRPRWTAVFDPEPNARRKHYFAPAERATIGVSSDPNYYQGNWFFTPGPLCYGLHLAGGWLAAGVAARPGEHNFDQFEYRGAPEGFALNLRYDGHTAGADDWESPHLVLLPADDEYGALAGYCAWLRNAGLAPTGNPAPHDWWRAPIFCGWGEQVVLDRRTSLTTPPPLRAADYCTQANYERFLSTLGRVGLAPGTVVIDDKWQRHYGLNTPDPAKWPDMPGFIRDQRDAGRRVLLWLRAWHPEGIPAGECLADGGGQPLGVDPSSPRYEARLRAQVRHMLLDLGADGFKIDFTHRLPAERNVRAAGGIWGVELLKRLLGIVHDAAKEVKADALIMAHTANPYFADVVDMLRLNDIASVVGQPSYLASMALRARVARLASPHWLVDTDNWPSPNREAWLEYCRAQPALGVPSLYYVTRIHHLAENGEVTDEPLRAEDYAELAALWAAYRRGALR